MPESLVILIIRQFFSTIYNNLSSIWKLYVYSLIGFFASSKISAEQHILQLVFFILYQNWEALASFREKKKKIIISKTIINRILFLTYVKNVFLIAHL